MRINLQRSVISKMNFQVYAELLEISNRTFFPRVIDNTTLNRVIAISRDV